MTFDPNTDALHIDPQYGEIEEEVAIDPHEAALTLLAHVRAQIEAVEADVLGGTALPAPSDVANLYARAQVYATLALVEAVQGLTRQIAET